MVSRQRNTRWTVIAASVAMALLLFGATAAFADGHQCYSCGSWCSQQGVQYGMWYNDGGTWVRVGGTGWGSCYPGTACFQQVSAACTQQCNACLAAGGHYGGEGHPEDYRNCETDETCRFITGVTHDGTQVTSVCMDFCACSAGYKCRDTQIATDGLVTTENFGCRCPS